MTPLPFNPRNKWWAFSSYYKFSFTFQCLEDPKWFASYGGESGQIYTFGCSAIASSWAEITERDTWTDEDLWNVIEGNHEYVYLYEMAPGDLGMVVHQRDG